MLKAHKLALLFPAVPPDEFAQIVADIKEKGLLEPIWTYEGAVLDGWHRYQAALEAGVEPIFREWEGEDPMAFVVSMNIMRRHLNESQRVMLLVQSIDEAEQLMPQGRPEKGAESAPLKTDDELAKMLGGHGSVRAIKRARRVLAKPKLKAAVIKGTKSLTQANEEIADEEKKAKGISTAKVLKKINLPPEGKKVVEAIISSAKEITSWKKEITSWKKAMMSGNLDPKTHYPLLYKSLGVIEEALGVIEEAIKDLRAWMKERMK